MCQAASETATWLRSRRARRPSNPCVVSHSAKAASSPGTAQSIRTIARQARVQGAVELRAIISKTGTIENLVVVSGHPMLVKSAIEAVRQWRYRAYLLNHEPIEVETEITVNFLLSGGCIAPAVETRRLQLPSAP